MNRGEKKLNLWKYYVFQPKFVAYKVRINTKFLHISFLVLSTTISARFLNFLGNNSKSAFNLPRHSCFNEMQISPLQFGKTVILGVLNYRLNRVWGANRKDPRQAPSYITGNLFSTQKPRLWSLIRCFRCFITHDCYNRLTTFFFKFEEFWKVLSLLQNFWLRILLVQNFLLIGLLYRVRHNYARINFKSLL